MKSAFSVVHTKRGDDKSYICDYNYATKTSSITADIAQKQTSCQFIVATSVSKYCVQVWNPYYRKDIDILEKIKDALPRWYIYHIVADLRG